MKFYIFIIIIILFISEIIKYEKCFLGLVKISIIVSFRYFLKFLQIYLFHQ